MSNHKQPKNKEQLRGAPLQSPVAVNAENKRYQWLWLVPLLVLGLFWFSQSQQNDFERLSYSEFKQKVQSGDVARVTFEGDKIEGWYRAPQGTGDNANATDSAAEDAQNTEQSAQFEGFTTVKPPLEDSALLGLLDRNKVTVQAESTDSGMWRLLLIGVLPWLLLLGLIFYSVRMQKRMYQGGGQGGPFNSANPRPNALPNKRRRSTLNRSPASKMPNATCARLSTTSKSRSATTSSRPRFPRAFC